MTEEHILWKREAEDSIKNMDGVFVNPKDFIHLYHRILSLLTSLQQAEERVKELEAMYVAVSLMSSERPLEGEEGRK